MNLNFKYANKIYKIFYMLTKICIYQAQTLYFSHFFTILKLKHQSKFQVI